jgi:hypothetical protein
MTGGGNAWKALRLALAALGAICLIGSPALAQVFTQPEATEKRPAPKPKPRPQPAKPAKPARPDAPPQKDARRATFSDPVAYCAAHPDIDQPAAPYSGEPAPSWIASAVPASSAPTQSYSWRCMNRRVLACAGAAAQDHCQKPSEDREPTAEMQQYCTGKRKGQVPDEIAGNTLPIWICSGGKPAISGYRAGLDPRGYLSSRWSDVTDFAPANMVGSIPKAYIGRWTGVISGKGFIFKIPFAMIVTVQGGRPNEKVGTIEYHSRDLQGQISLFCASNLYLRQSSAGQLELWERFHHGGLDGRCPAQERMKLQLRDGQVWTEWRKNSDDKIRMSGWLQRAGQ